jgi:hypothetical protein
MNLTEGCGDEPARAGDSQWRPLRGASLYRVLLPLWIKLEWMVGGFGGILEQIQALLESGKRLRARIWAWNGWIKGGNQIVDAIIFSR